MSVTKVLRQQDILSHIEKLAFWYYILFASFLIILSLIIAITMAEETNEMEKVERILLELNKTGLSYLKYRMQSII